MITGKDLVERGWPQGKVVGLALKAASDLRETGMAETEILAALEKVREDPPTTTHPSLGPLAEEWKKINAPEESELREPLPYSVWGPEMIEAGTLDQMENAMRLPISTVGALMPDAHLGYGLPVGGVLATKDAVIPWAVGVDISCMMRLSVFDVNHAVFDERGEDLREVLLRNTNFGAGSKFKEGRRPEHEVLDDEAWNATPFLRSLKDTGRAQLGTSGSGNHFVEWGVFEATGEAPEGLEKGKRHLALLSHSGSRGVGFKVANRYSRIAKQKHPKLDRSVADLAWLLLDSEEGDEYWLSMQLAGRFASANHAVIHRKIANALAEEPLFGVENYHNFAWKQENEEVIVHRKGATPAGRGVLGIIPGSMGDPGFVVRGKGDAKSLESASHGAGRRMSRTQAFKTLDKSAWEKGLREKNVTLIGGSLDEAPEAYKKIEEVMSLQTDLVEVVGRFDPRIVRMDSSQPRRKKK
ncbi:MAG: RtcB family protein [Rubrobacteraceae bacterium]